MANDRQGPTIMAPIDIQEIEDLHPMSPSVAQLASALAEEDVGLNEVVRLIELDGALTANVLRLANSAWSGSTEPIHTVQQAAVRVGANRILQLVVACELSGLMQEPCEGYELGEWELWRHSIATALAAELLSKMASEQVPGLTFTAALIHDIGKLLLTRYLVPEAVAGIRGLMESDGTLYIDAERQVLGTDHAEVGGEVARHWCFPDALVEAIERHHSPDDDPNPLLDAVHVANLVAKTIGMGLGTEQMQLHASEDAPHRLGLSLRDFAALCVDTLADLGAAEGMYRLAYGDD